MMKKAEALNNEIFRASHKLSKSVRQFSEFFSTIQDNSNTADALNNQVKAIVERTNSLEQSVSLKNFAKPGISPGADENSLSIFRLLTAGILPRID